MPPGLQIATMWKRRLKFATESLAKLSSRKNQYDRTEQLLHEEIELCTKELKAIEAAKPPKASVKDPQ